jgi:hypothetical protein
MPLTNSFENLMRSLPIVELILQMPAQALEIAMVRALLQEGKEMEEVLLLVVPMVVSAVTIQDLSTQDRLNTTTTYHVPKMMH